jgi:trigger factor
MQVSVEMGQGLERRLNVALPAETIEQEVQQRLLKLTRSAKVAGFRPGKVPLRVIQQKFGKQVRGEVIGELMQSSLNEAIKQQNLRPASGPRIEPRAEGDGLQYVATFEVFPEIDLASAEGFTIQRPTAEITDQDVDRMIEVLRKQRMTWTAVEQRPAQEGDLVTMDYEGIIDGAGEGQENKVQAQGVKVLLGSNSLLPELEQKLIGVSVGEERQVNVSFPQGYPNTNLDGKSVQFSIKVGAVEQPQLPQVDESFAEGFGLAQGGVDALRREVRANMQRELEQAVKGKVKKQVMALLLQAHPIELPRALVNKESQRLWQQSQSNMQARGAEAAAPDPSVLESQAKDRVALGLILGELVRRHGIKADPARVRATIDTIASTYEDPQAVARWIHGNREQLAEIESMVIEDQVVDWVLARAQVQEVATTFDAIMNRQAAGSEDSKQ